MTTGRRGYGAAHKAERERWRPMVEAGRAVCCRCGRPIRPWDVWHLDHTADRRGYAGPAHAWCNTSAGGRLGAAVTNAKRRRRRRKARRRDYDLLKSVW
jgi:hypothetical protein